MLRASGLAGMLFVLCIGTLACGKNPGQEDSKSLTGLHSVSDSTQSPLGPQSAARDSVRVSIQLQDGSRILGYPLLDTLTLQTQYATLRLALGLVRAIDFQESGNIATASLITGEQLQGTLTISTLPLRSLVGTLSVPIRDVSSITVSNRLSSLDSGLVAYYPFNGDARDKSGHGHDGTVNGAVLCGDRAGKPNSAFSFDGNDSYIAIPDGMIRRDGTSFTLSLWLSAADVGMNRMALYIGAAEGEASIQSKGTQIGLFLTLDGSQYISKGPLEANTWVHVVGVYRRGVTSQLWIDGKLKDEITIPESNLLHALPSHTSSIGSYAPAHFNHSHAYGIGSWKGVIDNVRIYNRALEQDEIMALFASGR